MDEADEGQQPPEEEAVRRNFERTIQRLENNEIEGGHFRLTDATIRAYRRMSVLQAKALVAALQNNTSVDRLTVSLHACPLPAVSLFIDYIRSSSRLKTVAVRYKTDAHDAQSEAIQERYKAQVDCLFRAMSENAFIKTLTVYAFGSCPLAIYDLLANSKSLTTFEMRFCRFTTELALSVMAGISRNSSLRNVHLQNNNGPVHLILPGIGASSVESLSISRVHDKSTWAAISKMLLLAQSLKLLTITNSRQDITNPRQDTIERRETPCTLLLDLCHPASNLQELVLRDIDFPADGAEESNPQGSAPILHSNVSLRKLTMDGVRFQNTFAVRLLWNMIGLEELDIKYSSFDSGSIQVSLIEPFAEFVRRNKKLHKICVCEGDVANYPIVHGVLEGARKHESLLDLKLVSVNGEDEVGLRLRQVLHETLSLKILYFDDVILEPPCAALLAEGLSQNESLRHLHFEHGSVPARSVTHIAESLLLNQTLEHLGFECLNNEYFPEGNTAICETISQVLRANSSLTSLSISAVDLCAEGTLSEILLSLRENKTLKTLKFYACRADNDVLATIGQALESNTISITEIGLCCGSYGMVDGITEEGRWAFLRSLKQMPHIQKVDFGETMIDIDEETRGLLLRAVRENKNICNIDNYESNIATYRDDKSVLRVEAEIKYYLELNHFGRRILDHPNILTSLWPRILSRMTDQPENAGALFYFLREYFSRRREETCEPIELQQPPEPPRKKARID